MRTTSSYRRSWPGRRLPEAALETPEPAMRQSCAAERAAGGSFCRTGRGCHVDRRAGQGARWPGRWCGHGTRPACFVWKVPVWSDGSTTLSNMCSGAGSGAAGSAGAGGAVDAGCLDPMLDRLLAVEVAGLPDEALAADLVGLRVAVSRLESEFARRLVVFDRRGAAGVTGAVSTAAWLRQACRLSAGEAGERVRTARVLADDLAASADALAGGFISYAHARVLASAAPRPARWPRPRGRAPRRAPPSRRRWPRCSDAGGRGPGRRPPRPRWDRAWSAPGCTAPGARPGRCAPRPQPGSAPPSA